MLIHSKFFEKVNLWRKILCKTCYFTNCVFLLLPRIKLSRSLFYFSATISWGDLHWRHNNRNVARSCRHQVVFKRLLLHFYVVVTGLTWKVAVLVSAVLRKCSAYTDPNTKLNSDQRKLLQRFCNKTHFEDFEMNFVFQFFSQVAKVHWRESNWRPSGTTKKFRRFNN